MQSYGRPSGANQGLPLQNNNPRTQTIVPRSNLQNVHRLAPTPQRTHINGQRVQQQPQIRLRQSRGNRMSVGATNANHQQINAVHLSQTQEDNPFGPAVNLNNSDSSSQRQANNQSKLRRNQQRPLAQNSGMNNRNTTHIPPSANIFGQNYQNTNESQPANNMNNNRTNSRTISALESQRNDQSISNFSRERVSDHQNKDRHRSTPNIDASSVNNPNQPLTLSERLNGLSTGNSVANFRRNTQNSSQIEAAPVQPTGIQSENRLTRHSQPQQYNPGQFLQLHQNNLQQQQVQHQQPIRNIQSTRNQSSINRVLTDQELQIKKDEEIAQALQREEEEKFARSLLLHQNNQVIRQMLAQRERELQNTDTNSRRRQVVSGSTNGGVRLRERTQDEARIVSLAQARRHHLRQQLTTEEQQEFDEQYGEEDDLVFDENAHGNPDEEDLDDDDYDDDNQFHSFHQDNPDEDQEDINEEDEEQMEYYMRQHPDILLALDYAAFRREQMQQRLHSNNSSGAAAQRGSLDEDGTTPRSQRGPASLLPDEIDREDFENVNRLEAEEAAILRNQRVNIGLSGLFSATDREAANNLYHHTTHSASNSLQGAVGGGLRGIELGMSLGVDVGTFSYQNRTGTQHEHILSQIREGANSASVTANVRTTGPTPQQARERRVNVRRVERDLEMERRTNEEANMMSRLLHQAEEEEYEDDDEEYESQNEEDDKDLNDDDNQDDDDEEENDLESYLRKRGQDESRLRARTAPLRPMEHIEQFKMTPNFKNLERAAVCANQIVQRNDQKFDLDSYEGQNSCKKFLSNIENLCDSLKIKSQNRTYRKTFSNAYKVLYKDGKLCYLTEILDSAQEAFPYLYVNGEKYVFSKQVIETGKRLFKNFCQLLYDTKESYQRICEEQSYQAILEMINEIRTILEEFDENWVEYEKLYVVELMLIEQDARRFIQEAIDVEREITSAEVRERAKGKIMVECSDHNKNRKKFVEILNKINSVANPDGKGRDDLEAEILLQSEGICRRISISQSKAVRKLAEAIKKSFAQLRSLMRKYGENIEGVDPQLKNNQDLVSALVDFETSWEKGKAYFVSPKKCQQLVHFTATIEATAEKYHMFHDQVQDRDTEIFVTIPALLILKCLDDDDKGICRSFFPPMFGEDGTTKDNEENEEVCYVDKVATHNKFLELKKDYQRFKNKSKNEYDFFNLVERSILGMENDETSAQSKEGVITDKELAQTGLERKEMHQIVSHIRVLSMQMQRYKPQEWNEFLIVALDS